MASQEVDHSPNKQSKTEAYSSNTDFPNSTVISASQINDLEQDHDLDPEYENSNIILQMDTKPGYYKNSLTDFSQSASSSVSSSTVSSSFPAKRRAHSMTPCGDNFSSYQSAKRLQSKPSTRYQSTASYLPSQLDSTMDLGYSSNSGDSSYQGHDKDSQRDSITVDQGSQLDLLMSPDQGAAWSDDNGGSNYLHGESELEDLLYHFQRFFEDRFESEINQFKESIHEIVQEQQGHVRQIVQRAMCTQDQASQNSSTEVTDSTVQNTSQTKSDVVSRLLGKDGTLCLPEDAISSIQLNRPIPQPAKDERRNKLLELLADSCSISSLLTKPEFR